MIFRFDAPLFFANARTFRDQIRRARGRPSRGPRWIVIAAEPITDVDTTAADMLDDLDEELNAAGTSLVFAELKDPVRDEARALRADRAARPRPLLPHAEGGGRRLPRTDRHRLGQAWSNGAMKLELGSAVACSDEPFGELADVVVDPLSRRVTHLVVQPHGRRDRARLVPVERARAGASGVALDCTVAEVEAMEPLFESAYLRVGEFPVADPDWDVGVEEVLALPVYKEMDDMGTAVEPDPHVIVNYDRIPKLEVEIRRSSAVVSSDGHHLGHVDGFLIGEGEMADIVLERGHLWGRREIVIPADAIAAVENDRVTLNLTKEAVGALDARRVHRWFSV